MRSLTNYYPCNGGSFFWVAEYDANESQSHIFDQDSFPYSLNSSDGPQPILSPIVLSPTKFPLRPITLQPIKHPTIVQIKSLVEAGSYYPNHTGLIVSKEYKVYHSFTNGSSANIAPQCCQDRFLFDGDLQVCDWAANVDY